MSFPPEYRGQVVDAWQTYDPALNDRTMRVVGSLKSIHEALARSSEKACQHHPVSPAELEVLVPLHRSGIAMTGAMLAYRLGMTRAGVAKHLKRLEARGLLSRDQMPGDKRSSAITLTEQGARVTESAFADELSEHARLLREVIDDKKLYEALAEAARKVAESAATAGGD